MMNKPKSDETIVIVNFFKYQEFPFYSGEYSQKTTNDAGQRKEVDKQQEGEVVGGVDNLGISSVESEHRLALDKGQV